MNNARPLVGLIVFFALLLRLPGFTESLWYDEIWSTRVILGSVAQTVRMLGSDLHPPVFNVLMFFWIRAFGDSEISVRMVPLLCGLITIPLTARLAADYGWRSAAPVAALILAMSPVHIWYSQESRSYAFLLLLVVASVVVFHRIRETHAARWYVVYAALAAAIVFTQYVAAIFVGIVMLLALDDPVGRARMWRIGAAIAMLLAVFLAVKWRWGKVPTGSGYLERFTLRDLWDLPFEWLFIGGVLGDAASRTAVARLTVLAVQILLLLLAVRGALRSRAPLELTLLIVGLPLAFFTLGLIGADHVYVARSAMTILPFMAVAVSIGGASLSRPVWRVSAVAALAAFGAVVLINYFAKSDQWTVYKPNADWRAVAHRLVEEHAHSGRPVVVLSMAPALELRYYDAGFGPAQLDDRSVDPQVAERSAVRTWLKRMFEVPVDPRRGQTGRIYEVYVPEVSLVRRIFVREGAAEIFLVRNAYWYGRSDKLVDLLRAEPDISVETIFAAKAISVIRIGLRASASGGL